ncbi:MAG TPA: hypothetical protein VFK02_06530 [Kofleriaceae bacterium]|nr:hypothetical protein [Kofleriaceae bacterium]
MSTIGGPGAPGGPGRPGGPGGPGGIDGPNGPGGADGPSEIGNVAGELPVEQVQGPVRASDVEALAAEIAAGRLTPREAIERLVDATAGPELDPTERAELRELLTDLVASDPYLGNLVGRI